MPFVPPQFSEPTQKILKCTSQYHRKYVFRGFVQLIENKKCRNVCFQLSRISIFLHPIDSILRLRCEKHDYGHCIKSTSSDFLLFASNCSLASCILASSSLASSPFLSKPISHARNKLPYDCRKERNLDTLGGALHLIIDLY